jgi:enamine deaminase RidA (YjgF/YER057c/UK114 family)
MAGQTEAALAALNVTLPAASAPAGSYVPVVRTGNLLFVSGQIPMGANGLEYVGRLGENISLVDGQAAAKLCAVNILAQVKTAIGDLDGISRIVKVTGFVNSAPSFGDQPKVVNGASDFLVAALGERGRHARAAVGVASLPFGVAVEVEAVVEVAD